VLEGGHARGAGLASRMPSSSKGKATFSAAVRPGRRLKSWKTWPTVLRLRRALSLRDILESEAPAMRTSPLVGSSRLPAIVSSVDFPEPDGPITATSEPRSTPKSTSESACTSVAPAP